MGAFGNVIPIGKKSLAFQPLSSPYSPSWLAVIAFSEILFVLCRGTIGYGISLDDPILWLAGLAPFALAASSVKIVGRFPALYLYVWIAALATFFLFRCFNLAHYIELPLFSAMPVGFLRDFIYAAFYTGAGLVLLMSLHAAYKRIRANVRSIDYSLSVVFISIFACTTTLTLTLF